MDKRTKKRIKEILKKKFLNSRDEQVLEDRIFNILEEHSKLDDEEYDINKKLRGEE